jgi:hypothetical protein
LTLSYILEALKKLEEKRRSETAPYFLSEEHSVRQNRKIHFPWRYIIVFSFLLNAGIFLWWLHPWRSEKDVGTGMGNVTQEAPAQGRDMGGEGMAGRPGSHGRQQQDAIMKTEDGLSPGYGAGHGDGAAVVSPQPPGLSSDKAGGDKRVINMSELPLSVRQRLPDLTVSGHFYNSRPSSRIVTLSGRTLHEGDAAAPGIKIERITTDGVVFSFEGYSFQRGIF